MSINCLFCEEDVFINEGVKPSRTMYRCPRCGYVNLEREAVEDFNHRDFKKEDRLAVSMTLRNEWERSKKKVPSRKLTYSDLLNIKRQFEHLDPIQKLDQALLTISGISNRIGDVVIVNNKNDYPLYYCSNSLELVSVIKLLASDGFISQINQHELFKFQITTSGYRKIRDLMRYNKESNQCFVAMWFTDEMNEIYEGSIKKAIEFIEPGKTRPRFKAVKIDNIEHANDINDEIIAQIRRSRFMVCDLTGYRGGVYFEAGFAYGLGLDVIYTCRDDWTKEEYFKDSSGEEITSLYDSNKSEIKIKKEGVHFDLAHRNRIEWSPAKPEEFTEKLTNRIKALIY